MNIKTLSKNNQSGEIILFVVFVILFMVMFVGFFVSRLIVWQTKVSLNWANSVQAYYITDSGVESVMYLLATSENVSVKKGDRITMPDFAFDSKPVAEVTRADTVLQIEVNGVYKDSASRAIQLSW